MNKKIFIVAGLKSNLQVNQKKSNIFARSLMEIFFENNHDDCTTIQITMFISRRFLLQKKTCGETSVFV